jgi:hypothetical protein
MCSAWATVSATFALTGKAAFVVDLGFLQSHSVRFRRSRVLNQCNERRSGHSPQWSSLGGLPHRPLVLRRCPPRMTS